MPDIHPPTPKKFLTNQGENTLSKRLEKAKQSVTLGKLEDILGRLEVSFLDVFGKSSRK